VPLTVDLVTDEAPLATDFGAEALVTEVGAEGEALAVTVFLFFFVVGFLAVVTGFLVVVVGFLAVVTGFFIVIGLGLLGLAAMTGFGLGGATTTGGAVGAAKDREFAVANKTAHNPIMNFFKSVLLVLTTENYIESV
jgi:hypothetical protein